MASTTTELFSIPIAAEASYAEGRIVCTTPAPKVYLLTFTSGKDNRLTPSFCRAFLAALDTIELEHSAGVVVTTSGIAKFYSNGLDLQLALSIPAFWEDSLYPLYRRLLTYPMPTVALINGHAFAGGIMLAMHQDYRVFIDGAKTGRNAFACVNELEFGAPLPPPLSSIFRIKTPPHVYRKLVLEAYRFDGPAALEAGLVDAVGGLDAALQLIRDLDLVKKGAKGSYGALKEEMYKESIALLEMKGPNAAGESLIDINDRRKKDAERRVQLWKEGQGQKAKL